MRLDRGSIFLRETGAGKSAVLSAIRLILGERADLQLVGTHGDLAVIEAEVVVGEKKAHVRREIHRSGKSRCFIDDELVTLGELRSFFQGTIELTDQGSAFKFSDPEELRRLLDVYGKIDLKPYAELYDLCQQKRLALEELLKSREQMRAEEGRLREQFSLLEGVNWQPGEEEELTQTHTALTQEQKSAEKLGEMAAFLEGTALLPNLKRFGAQSEALQISDLSTALKSAHAHLEEASHFLDSFLANLDCNAEKVVRVEERMAEIDAVKRRLAKTQEDAANLQENLRAKLQKLDNIDEEVEIAKMAFSTLEQNLALLEKSLSAKRSVAAEKLTKAVLEEVQALNLPDAQLLIQLQPKKGSATGGDAVEWLFSANLGQPLLPLDQVASGGELSRLLLALKIAMKEKKCLILDEIDSNVGGQTATLLGLTLKKLGETCQIICITHFIQVAKHAMHHFLVSKRTVGPRTVTSLQKLDVVARLEEYARMTGGAE